MKPEIRIEYCVGCRFVVRASWIAQELLFTFGEKLGAVSLVPGSAGVFVVRLDGDVIFDKSLQGRFPDPRELRALVRDAIAPELDLGHSEPKDV